MSTRAPNTEELATATQQGDAAEEPRGSRNPFSGLSAGDLGVLRVVVAIALVWAIFYFKSNDGVFLGAFNLTNLTLQIAAVGTVSIGIVLVLLLGEIDLSVGSVAGLGAAVATVLATKNGWDAGPAIAAALGVGAAIGLIHGFFVTYFGIPSFVVTLAGLIGWMGLQSAVLGNTKTLNLPNPGTIVDLAHNFYSPTVGWILAALAIGAFVGSGLYGRRRRVAAGLEVGDMRLFILRAVLVAVAVIATIGFVYNQDRGVPLSPLILVGLVAIFAFLTERTRWGRYVFAVGGNAEAARRAGIKVNRVKIGVFMLASTLAAAGGLLLASRQYFASSATGGSDFLLLAIAGPVVAGTSLFGGVGTVWSALLGGLLMGSISNGMDLLALDDSTKNMITGGVLLAAVVLDAATRKRRGAVVRR